MLPQLEHTVAGGDDSSASEMVYRFWWLKRFCVAGCTLLVALALLRWAWGCEAERRLQAQIDRYRAAGYPAYASEIDRKLEEVPEHLNAAVLWEKAIQDITLSSQSGVGVDDFVNDPNLFDKKPNYAAELMEQNANVFALVREAMQKPQVAWSPRLKDYLENGYVDFHAGQRRLAKLLYLNVLYRFQTGDHAGAVATLREILELAEDVYADPTLMGCYVGWAIEGWPIEWLEDSGSNLRIGDGNGEGTSVGREQLVELIRMLLNDEPSRNALAAALRAVSSLTLGILDNPNWRSFTLGGPVTPSLGTRLYDALQRPTLKLDAARALPRHAELAELVAKEEWREAVFYYQKHPQPSSLIEQLSQPLSSFGETDSLCQTVDLYRRQLAKRRMAAVALAVRQYVVEQGQWPESLDSLVPTYLDAVPADPFASSRLRYKPQAQRPILYSVGGDQVDDDGVPAIRSDGWSDYRIKDIVFYLNGKPAEPSSTQTSDDDENEQNDNGQKDQKQNGQQEP